MNMWAFVSMSAFVVLLMLNAGVHIWAPPYDPLRRVLQLSMFAYLLFAAGDVTTYLVTTEAGYTAAVMIRPAALPLRAAGRGWSELHPLGADPRHR